MSSEIKWGLTQKERRTILEILQTFAGHIEKVGIFGSRASGEYKEYSDIDLVLYGSIDEAHTDRLYTLFDESDLGLRVDISAYERLNYAPLKRHIDTTAKTMFTKNELRKT